jgi:hypothetical protein
VGIAAALIETDAKEMASHKPTLTLLRDHAHLA